MRHILVTGANKGIGFAIARAILEQHDDTAVYLGSRDVARGREAAAKLAHDQSSAWQKRIEVLPLDVASDRSVTEAAALVARSLGSEKLYGIVNNAGVGSGDGTKVADILAVNTLGVARVCEAFIPLLTPDGGRIVNVTSASGPQFVASCTPDRQRFFLDRNLAWPALRAFVEECMAIGEDKAALAAKGLGDGGGYGLSKACANTYTMIVAREHPRLRVNACTPGFIETDMTKHYAASQGKSAAELGMKTPAEGAKSTLFLLFGEPEGNGRYYGSDAQRSPLDRYRSPGSAPYTGD